MAKVARPTGTRLFSQSVSMAELMHNSLSSNILLYKTAQGEARVEVISIAKHSGCHKKDGGLVWG